MDYSFTDRVVAKAVADELYKAKETEDILIFDCGEFVGRFDSYDEYPPTDDNLDSLINFGDSIKKRWHKLRNSNKKLSTNIIEKAYLGVLLEDAVGWFLKAWPEFGGFIRDSFVNRMHGFTSYGEAILDALGGGSPHGISVGEEFYNLVREFKERESEERVAKLVADTERLVEVPEKPIWDAWWDVYDNSALFGEANRRVKTLGELIDGEDGVVEKTAALKHLRTNFRKINDFKNR